MTDIPDEIATMGLAWHEVGHGMAGWAGGLHVYHMRINRSLWDGKVTCGYTLIGCPDKTAPAARHNAVAVMIFAGQIAQLRYLDQAGVLDSSIQARVERGSASDYEHWQEIRGLCSMNEAEARKAADRLINRYYGRMQARAERLAARARLAGSAL